MVARCRTRKTSTLLAAVAGDEAAVLALGVLAEVVDGEQARVGAALAADGAVRRVERVELLGRKQRRALALRCAIAREEGRAVGAHVSGNVGAHRVDAGELLEGTQHRVVQERAALHDDVVADVVRVADLDYLEQRVLDDGDGKARGDVADGGAFLLGLLHTAVHEHGAAAAQVDGTLGLDGRLRELRNVQAEAAREALDEAAAARAAGLVEHDVVDNAVLDAQAFHVLAADIEDELDVREHLAGTAQMGDRLDFAGVDLQRLQEKALAIAGNRGVPDGDAFGQVGVELLERSTGATENVALVGNVMGPEDLAVLADENRLERGRARIDAQERRALVGGEVGALHALGIVACAELVVFGFAGEERVEAHDLGALQIAEIVQALDDVVQALLLDALHLGSRSRAAARHEQVGVVRHDDVLVVEVKCIVETFSEFGQILQRTAEEGDVPSNGAPAREAADGLRDDGLEDARGDVLLARALVEQRLDVGLREHAAAARDRVDRGVVGGQLVEPARIGVEQGGHLVDERAGAACAGSVHALLDGLAEVDDLGVLAA